MYSNKYDDIIDLPHHVSQKHAHMSNADRAAQFAPFAALTGYGDVICETARITDSKIELDDSEKARLDAKLNVLLDTVDTHPLFTITFFESDLRKSGGQYLTLNVNLKKIDSLQQVIYLGDGRKIAFADILSLDGPLFAGLD